ncbi:MAG TPA: L-threonylcarbamoyladenylate synthase [Vicinamibacterales bacterium]|jgi:L-threonylcarbamoyladenylate synthase
MAIRLPIDPAAPDDALLRRAGHFVRGGLVVAYPTDTVYGLAVDPRNALAVRRLFALKGRPDSSAVTLIAASVDQASLAGELSPAAARLAAVWWPGPLTIVVRATSAIAPETLAGGATVGIRVPANTIAAGLAAAAGFCITATSANRSGAAPASRADEVLRSLPGVDAIVDGGPSATPTPSTIVDATVEPLSLIRAGAVAWERVLESLT